MVDQPAAKSPVRPAATKSSQEPPRTKSRLSQVGAAFWAGFSGVDPLAFKVFCGSLLATCALTLWFFSEATLAGPFGQYLPRSSLDAEGFATHEALRSGHMTPDHPRLFVLGTSTIAQALASDTALEKQIYEATGQKWEVVILSTPLQSPVDQFALLDRALESQTEKSPPVIAAVGFGVQRLRWTVERTLQYAATPRLGLQSDWADAEIMRLGGKPAARTGFYARDNLAFVLINGAESLGRLITLHPAMKHFDQYALGVAKPPNPNNRKTLGSEIKSGSIEQPAYFAQINRLADNLATVPKSEFVLIEEPLSPGLVKDQSLAPAQDALIEGFSKFSAKRPLAFWQITTEAGLSQDDFFDDLHVKPGAPQAKVQAALVKHVVAWIKASHGK